MEPNDMDDDANLTRFDLDEARLAELQPLIDDYSVATDPDAEFPNNVLSKRTVVWTNGAFGKRGDTPVFDVEAAELRQCRAIADGAKAIAGDLEVGFGSESSDPFLPFYMARNTFQTHPERITGEVIRTAFAGTLFPAFSITVEPMNDRASWWEQLVEDAETLEPADLDRWIALRDYFAAHPDCRDTAFVSIGQEEEGWATQGDWPKGTVMAPSVFPRLLLGLTNGGSLAGLFGWCVYT